MATLSFRLPALRLEAGAMRRSQPHRTLSPGHQARSGEPRPMNAEAAALIALRRLDAAALGETPDASDDEEVCSSSWFVSTWELAQGLEIREGLPTDMPLDGWLQLYLAQDPALTAASPAGAAA